MDNINKNYDIDIEETNDWIESIKSLVQNSGNERAKYMIEKSEEALGSIVSRKDNEFDNFIANITSYKF